MLSHIKPYTTDMVASKGATVLATNADAWTPHTPNAVVGVLQSTLDKRPQLVSNFLKGMICGADVINRTPQQAVDLLVKGNYYRVPPAVLLKSFESAPEKISFFPDVQAVQSVVDDLAKLGYIKGQAGKASVSADDIFKLDRIKSLEK